MLCTRIHYPFLSIYSFSWSPTIKTFKYSCRLNFKISCAGFSASFCSWNIQRKKTDIHWLCAYNCFRRHWKWKLLPCIKTMLMQKRGRRLRKPASEWENQTLGTYTIKCFLAIFQQVHFKMLLILWTFCSKCMSQVRDCIINPIRIVTYNFNAQHNDAPCFFLSFYFFLLFHSFSVLYLVALVFARLAFVRKLIVIIWFWFEKVFPLVHRATERH